MLLACNANRRVPARAASSRWFPAPAAKGADRITAAVIPLRNRPAVPTLLLSVNAAKGGDPMSVTINRGFALPAGLVSGAASGASL